MTAFRGKASPNHPREGTLYPACKTWGSKKKKKNERREGCTASIKAKAGDRAVCGEEGGGEEEVAERKAPKNEKTPERAERAAGGERRGGWRGERRGTALLALYLYKPWYLQPPIRGGCGPESQHYIRRLVYGVLAFWAPNAAMFSARL
jgi:hypothetical protein